MDPFQYPYHGYNMEENYGNPNFPLRYSQEPETPQRSSVFNRLERRRPKNKREKRAGTTVGRAPHMSPPLNTKLNKRVYHLVRDRYRSPIRGCGKPNGSALWQQSLYLSSDPMRLMTMMRQVHSQKGYNDVRSRMISRCMRYANMPGERI
ncbi:hypothetical protein Fot_05467 [Forsythia ovata]|uniref:Uncharacterized protein n=1 Tax=Forsythia ovata TaxID=205694 RepID=A0ABD1WQ97_9LAMI